LRNALLGALVIGLVAVSSPALSHLPNFANGQMPTLAPLVREVIPCVVNISVHGRIKEENPLYRDPLFREFLDVPNNWNGNFKQRAQASLSMLGRDIF